MGVMCRVLTRSEDIEVVFRDSDRHTKAANNDAGWYMGEILGECVGLISRGEWRVLRAVTEVPFNHEKVVTYIHHIKHRTQRHFDSLIAKSRLSEGVINPVEDLKMLPFWIVADIIYGDLSSEMEHQLEALIPLRESLFKHVISGGLIRFWWSQFLPSRKNRELAEFRVAWADFNDQAHKRCLSTAVSMPLVKMYEAVQKKDITREQLLQTLDEMLFANLDVTIGGISWNLLFLAANPDAQARLRRELVEARSGREQYLLSPSTFLASCISESSRLKPLAAFSVPQAAPSDRIVSGFAIPAGTNFIVDTYALNVRNPYWGNDSTVYRPERFMEQDFRKKRERRYNFWRFGFGPRTCMGKYAADVIIRVLLAHLVDNYRLELPLNREKWGRSANSWITHPEDHVICQRLEETIDAAGER